MKITYLVLCALPLVLTACLENEESFKIRSDGSVTLRVRAEGDVVDLAGGYPVPLGGEWSPVGEATRLWLSAVGSDTGGIGVQEKIGAGLWEELVADPDAKVTLAVQASFDSVAAIPTRFVAANEPYADAYHERTANLTITRKAGRTVYVFERRFHSREKERTTLADIYTLGDGSVSVEAFERTVERAEAELDRVMNMERVIRAWDENDEIEARKKAGEDEEWLNPFQVFEEEVRDALRRGVATLKDEDVDTALVNGVLYRLEWLFTKDDHTSDLGDEKFKLLVEMPGAIVSGNHTAIDDEGRAQFEFEGKDFANSDVVSRVVSVEE